MLDKFVLQRGSCCSVGTNYIILAATPPHTFAKRKFLRHAPPNFSNNADGDAWKTHSLWENMAEEQELLAAEVQKYKHLYKSSQRDHCDDRVNVFCCSLVPWKMCL